MGLGLALSCATCAQGGKIQPPSFASSPTSATEVVLSTPPPAADPPVAPPFQLTSSEGVGLRLASVRARAAIQDPLALTELHLVFQNPEARRIEGRFTLALPVHASLGRFAMRIGTELEEGEVVEKTAARLTYEEYLHVRRDPALLEQGAANEVAVRVFPIEAFERKEIVVTYSETLDSSAPYRLRLAGLPEIGELDAVAYVDGVEVAKRSAEKQVASSDFVVDAAAWSKGEQAAVGGGADVALRVRLAGETTPAAPTDAVVALVDTSASRALDLVHETELVAELGRALPPSTRLVVSAYDQEVEPIFDGDASTLDEPALTRLRSRRALGASDLSAALRHAYAVAPKTPGETRRLVLFGDGVATSGDTDAPTLADLTRALGRAGYVRADAVATGGLRDVDTLRAIVRGALPKAGVVVGEEAGIATLRRRFETEAAAARPIAVKGASFVSPSVLDGAMPGDDVLVLASFPGGHAPRSVEGSLGEQTFSIQRRETPAPLVGRAVASARIRKIEADRELPEAKKKQQIVALAIQHRVESAYTAMLVLENDEAYAQHHIDRKAKLDLLTVTDGKVAVQARPRPAASKEPASPAEARPTRDPSTPPTPPAAPPAVPPAASQPPASHASVRAPQVRMGATMVSGRLPPETVQRVIRLSFGRFRACYRAGLLANPSLEGRVVLDFMIGRDGSVSSATDGGSTLASRTVVQCMVRATYGLAFPQPEGGVVHVIYPMVLQPDGIEAASTLLGPVVPRRRVPFSIMSTTESDPLAGSVGVSPYDGAFGGVMEAIAANAPASALTQAWRQLAAQPTEVLSFVALGRAAELAGDTRLAARAYGSILELWSYRVDMRRFAGEQLEHLGDSHALALAGDAYRGAAEDRPDHPSSHWLLAMNLLRRGDPASAFAALERGLDRDYAFGRNAGSTELMRDDLAMIAAVWAKLVPNKREDIAARLVRHSRTIDTSDHVRVTLVWETDANDVDLYLTDSHGDHTYFGRRTNGRGGRLYGDITNGYGPEGFDAPVLGELDESYRLRVNYFARGPMGFGMGKVTVVRHDGAGTVTFDDRPFVLTTSRAVVDLGKYRVTK